MLLENLAAYLVFVKRFIPNSLEEGGQSVLEPILTVLLVFMSGCNRARNPHLRASLAECLECLIGKDLDNPGQTMMGTFFRDRLFQQHPHRNQVLLIFFIQFYFILVRFKMFFKLNFFFNFKSFLLLEKVENSYIMKPYIMLFYYKFKIRLGEICKYFKVLVISKYLKLSLYTTLILKSKNLY